MGEPRSMETSYVEKICDSRLAMTRNLCHYMTSRLRRLRGRVQCSGDNS
jgi:hypothetical protein